MKNIFDTHAHYDDPAFNNDRDLLLKEINSEGVCTIINVGTDINSSKESIKLSDKYSFIYSAIGIHPQGIENLPKNYLNVLKDLSNHKKTVAIGEIGLDYHYEFASKEAQKNIFEAQLKLANELNLPVIIHNREAHEDTLALLKKYKPRGVIHCFSGSVEMAREVISLGIYIGLGGTVTFKNAKNPVLVAESIPIDKLLLETDAPYMSPVPYRGKRCDSSLIQYTAQKISNIKKMDINSLLNITKGNAERLFLS